MDLGIRWILPLALVAQADTWDALANEYEEAFMRWAAEMSRTGAWEKPEAEREPSPALALRPRFEALADAGEGRAVLWLLRNYGGAPEDAVAERAARDLARLAAGGDAEWVSDALGILAERTDRFAPDALDAYLAERVEGEHPMAVRAHARLALAALVATEDAARAAELRTSAALLRWLDVDVAPGEVLAPEDLDELAEKTVAGVEAERATYFERAYREGDDGTYYPRSACPPDPQELWTPVLEALGERGALGARKWLLFNTWAMDEAGKERHRGHLDALSKTELDAKSLGELGWRVDSLVQVLGVEFVEPRVRAIAERAPEESRRALLLGLGDGLCETATDDAQRERGLALLREIGTRWPDSPEGQRAKGKLFRHENLVVGKPVPDFETVDVDGNAFKLSDYKGKVTVIDFWGFW